MKSFEAPRIPEIKIEKATFQSIPSNSIVIFGANISLTAGGVLYSFPAENLFVRRSNYTQAIVFSFDVCI